MNIRIDWSYKSHLLLLTFLLLSLVGNTQIRVRSTPDFGDRFVDGPHMSNPKGDYYFSLDSSAVYVTSSGANPTDSLKSNSTNSVFKEVFCVNCSEHKQYNIPEVVDVPTIKSISLQTDCSLIKNTYNNVFVVQGEHNETIPLNIAVGNDRTMVCFADVDEVISVDIEGNRKIDFLRLDTLSILKKVFTDLQLSFNEKTLKPLNWKIEGNYLGKISDTEYLFEWYLMIYGDHYWLNQYLFQSTIDRNLDISLVRITRLESWPWSDIHRGKSSNILISEYFFKQLVNYISIEKEPIDEKETESRKKEEVIIKRDEEYLEDPPLRQKIDVKTFHGVQLHKLKPDGAAFKIETDTINQSWYPKKEFLASSCSSIDPNVPIFWKIGQVTMEKGLGTLKQRLVSEDVEPLYRAWCNWDFLGYKIRNGDLVKFDKVSSTFNSPHTLFELTKFSMASADTFLVKSYLPMFFLDYKITDEGKLLLLTRCRFSESNFGSRFHYYLRARTYFSSAFYDNGNSKNDENLNPDLISFINYIEVSSLNNPDSSRYKRTTKCDISGVNFNKNHFDAILKNGEEHLGTLDLGIYSTSELKGSKFESKKKQDDAIYILVGGYIFKFDTRKRVFWTGDGTKIRKVKNVNDAIDLSIRSLLFLNYNIKLTEPICHV